MCPLKRTTTRPNLLEKSACVMCKTHDESLILFLLLPLASTLRYISFGFVIGFGSNLLKPSGSKLRNCRSRHTTSCPAANTLYNLSNEWHLSNLRDIQSCWIYVVILSTFHGKTLLHLRIRSSYMSRTSMSSRALSCSLIQSQSSRVPNVKSCKKKKVPQHFILLLLLNGHCVIDGFVPRCGFAKGILAHFQIFRIILDYRLESRLEFHPFF